jgi:hypothetical protein
MTPIATTASLLLGPKRNELLELWEVERFGRDCLLAKQAIKAELRLHPDLVRPLSLGRATRTKKKALICSVFLKPSDGLEPVRPRATTSLQERAQTSANAACVPRVKLLHRR